MTKFDDIRRFIRYGEGIGAELVSVQRASVLVGPEAATSRTHGMGFAERQELVGIATFFNEMTPACDWVTTTTAEWVGLSSIHFFDPTTKEIKVAQRAPNQRQGSRAV